MTKYKLFLVLSLACFTATAQDLSQIDILLWNGDAAHALQRIEEELSKEPSGPHLFSLQNKKAEAQIRAGNYDEAEEILKKLKQQEQNKNNTYSASVASNYGFLFLMRGRNDLALESLQDALSDWEQADKHTSLEAAQTQAHLGNLFRATGKYKQAEEQLTMALLTRQKLLPASHELIAASYNDLGLIYSITDKEKALEYYKKALTLYQQLHGKSHPKIAQANTNLGYLNSQLNLYDDAISNFELALTIWDKMYSTPHPSKGFVQFNLGRTYEKMNDLKTASLFYNQALATYQESYKSKHPDIARVYNALGNLELASNKFKEALDFYQKAIHMNVLDFNSPDVLTNPTVTGFYDGYVLLYSLLYKAQALELTYTRKSLRFSDLKHAIQTLHTCDTLIEKLRQQIVDEKDKLTLGAIAHEVYTDGVRICTHAALVAWKKQPYREDAFFFSEKNKAAVLLGALSDSHAKSFARIPEALLEEEMSLKSAIAQCAQNLSLKPGEEEEKQLRQTSYALTRKYEYFSKRLEQEFPAYYNLKYNVTSPAIPRLQEKLDGQTMLLSYFIDDKNNKLYLFTVTKKKFGIQEVSLPQAFNKYITGLRNGMLYSEVKTFIKASENLAALLIPKDIPAAIQHLVIIPTARLSIIPFETLLTSSTTDNQTFRTLPYLINRFTIRYEFSSGLIMQKEPSTNMAKPSILLYAPVQFNDGLSDLPGTEKEVNDISRLFTARNYTNSISIHQKANENNLKQEDLSNYSFLHFATHGLVDEENPDLSRIFLQTSHSEDGNLYTGEIYNLELNANLVTLSACQTGLGKISKGEGVIGLSRALVYAGAKNCMVSFWNVADESTARFMEDFYKILLEDTSGNLTTSLTKAKQNLKQSDKYASPYYWAPFVLIGF